MDTLVSLILMIISFPEQLSSRAAAESTKLTGAEAKSLFERLAKGGMGIVTGGQGHLRNIHCTHAQFSSRTLQPRSTNISSNALAHIRREDAMQMRHGETGHGRQDFAVQWFADVLADVALDVSNAPGIVLSTLSISHHRHHIIAEHLFATLNVSSCEMLIGRHADIMRHLIPEGNFVKQPGVVDSAAGPIIRAPAPA